MDREPIDVTLLGRFTVAVGDRTVGEEEWHLSRAADLVKMLALTPRHRLPRDRVIEALWPDGDPARGPANVRKVAFAARRALGVPEGIVLADGVVRLAPGHRVRVDVERFAEAARVALAAEDPQACRDAASTYGGDLLPDDPYAGWCLEERRNLRSLYVDLLASGELWGRLVREEPTDERGHREIIRAHLANGNRAGAIRQFDVLRTTLREDLGVSPGPATIALYEQVLDMDGRDAPTPAERARALLAWGLVHWRRADLDEAARTAAEARALAIDAGLPRELTEASELLGLVAYAQGQWRDVFARSFLETLTDAEDLAPFILDANMCMSEFALAEPTGVADVTELSEQLIGVADEYGSTHAQALGSLLRGEAALVSDLDPRRSRDDLEHAAHLHRSVSSVTGWALAVERLAQLDSHLGEQERARDRHEEALRIAEGTSVPEHLLPFIHGGMLEGERDEGALRVIDRAEQTTHRLRVCDPCSMAFRVGAAAACARSGQVDRAQTYLTEARRVADMWSGGPWHAAVDEAEAAVQLARGAEPSEVIRLLERAANRFHAARRPRDAVRCRRAAAQNAEAHLAP